jgi:hypothetical protein
MTKITKSFIIKSLEELNRVGNTKFSSTLRDSEVSFDLSVLGKDIPQIPESNWKTTRR